MRTRIHLTVILMVIIIATGAAPVGADELDENLSMFAELIGKQWEGHFEDADESMRLYMSWEPIIGGAAIQMSGWSTGSDMTRRNIYYWDRAKKQVAFLAITSNGYTATGTVQLENKVLIFIGQQIWPDGSVHDTMSRWEFLPDGNVRAIGYGKEGDDWVPGHKILFEVKDSG
jgi:hypothetical protein